MAPYLIVGKCSTCLHTPNFLFDGQELTSLKELKWLGIWFDKKLNISKQHTQVRNKADETIGQLLKIGGSRWGIREQERGLLIPRVLYGVAVWFTQVNQQKVSSILDLIEH
jgi:hypothetical protein